MEDLQVLTFTLGPIHTNCYAVIDTSSHSLYAIDAPLGSYEVYKQICQEKQVHVKELFLTHSHWDHFADAALITEHYRLKAWIHNKDLQNLLKPGCDAIALPPGLNIPSCTQFQLYPEKNLRLDAQVINVLHTPGHSPGSICLYYEHLGYLFSGDLVMHETFGNISFPHSECFKMKESLKRIAKLPSNTVIFPGHGPRTTVGQEPWLGHIDSLFESYGL